MLSRILAAVRELMERAAARGEVPKELRNFRSSWARPAVVAILWNSLFERFEPLDVKAFLHAYLDIVFGKEKAP